MYGKEEFMKFTNVLQSENKTTLFVYGSIYESESSAASFCKALSAIPRLQLVDVRINSRGGDIMEGIAIFNALRASDANIMIYIDGIAASMAAVIALCGKPVFMSQYARLMIHAATGGAWGNAGKLREIIVQLDSLDNTLAAMLGGKIGKPAEEIKQLYFDGKDHYLTAEEALALGIIDGIYDGTPPLENMSAEEAFTVFYNRLNTKPEIMYENIKKQKVFEDCKTDQEVEQRIRELETQAGEIAALKQKVTAFENAEKEANTAAINALVDAAVKEHRIEEGQRAVYEALLHADRTNGEAVLKGLAPKKDVNGFIDEQNKTTSAWDTRIEEIRKENK